MRINMEYPKGCCGMPCHYCITSFDLRNPEIPQFPLDTAIMVLCEYCQNKRCPHASDHRQDCTNSNDSGQAGSIYQAFDL